MAIIQRTRSSVEDRKRKILLELEEREMEGGRECRENGYSCWLFGRFGVGQIRQLSSGYFFFLGGKGSDVIN